MSNVFYTDMAAECLRMAETLDRVEALVERWEAAGIFPGRAAELRDALANTPTAVEDAAVGPRTTETSTKATTETLGPQIEREARQ